VKRSEAPRPGWYPDPAGGSRLRWWEGDDWSDRFRARPPDMQRVPEGQMTPGQGAWADQVGHAAQQAGQYAQQYQQQLDSAQIVEQVRRAAREEAQRASQLFGQQARAATRNIAPLITEYTTKIGRVIRFLSVVAIIVLVLYVGFQIWAQQSLFDWIGDRIDNLTDRDAGALVGLPIRR
jgi:hypothetical protein